MLSIGFGSCVEVRHVSPRIICLRKVCPNTVGKDKKKLLIARTITAIEQIQYFLTILESGICHIFL
jgi:hypothetical protein